MKSPKSLMLVLLVLVALGAVSVWMLVKGGAEPTSGPGTRPEPRGAQEPQASDDRASSVQPRAADPTVASTRKIRRIRDRVQRRKLLGKILAAGELRKRIAVERALADSAGAVYPGGAGTLSKESIREAVAAVIEDVKVCYEDQLELTPDLGGKIVVNFEVVAEEGAGGLVERVEIDEESDEVMRENQQLSDCIVDTINTLELPEPEGGGVVEVSYPFVMRPSEPEEEQPTR